jgi:branched-chain amino acid transport system substrate-binding protein
MHATFKRSLAAISLALGACATLVPAAQAANEQFFPLATYRVGAYASSGIPVWAGMIDYLRYINEVEGGINGVKLVWQECETEWTAEKGIECYERFKNGLDGAPVAVYQPNGAPAAYALADKAEADRIPLITLGYGRTEATDGRVFPYNFPAMLTFYSEASAFINYVAEREGGLDKRPMVGKPRGRWRCWRRSMASRTSRSRWPTRAMNRPGSGARCGN